MNVQLTYRGCSYQSELVALPLIRREIKLAGQYRGKATNLRVYEFQPTRPMHLNWRTMRFLGKFYLATPSLSFEAVQQ